MYAYIMFYMGCALFKMKGYASISHIVKLVTVFRKTNKYVDISCPLLDFILCILLDKGSCSFTNNQTKLTLSSKYEEHNNNTEGFTLI